MERKGEGGERHAAPGMGFRTLSRAGQERLKGWEKSNEHQKKDSSLGALERSQKVPMGASSLNTSPKTLREIKLIKKRWEF